MREGEREGERKVREGERESGVKEGERKGGMKNVSGRLADFSIILPLQNVSVTNSYKKLLSVNKTMFSLEKHKGLR